MSPYFRQKIRWLGVFILLWGGVPSAHADQCPELDQVMVHFAALSKIPRISGHESQAVTFIQQQARIRNRPFWSDEAGNTLVLVPPTGKYRDRGGPYIGLQSHVDMVAFVEGVKVEDPAEWLPYFKDGVEFEVEDGWLQSKNQRTTLGIDDGWGVGMMLRYMDDLTIPHPGLALLFTVNEEGGLKGAKALGEDLRRRLRVPVLINLDSTVQTEKPMLCSGCGGGRALKVEHTFPSHPVPPNLVHYEFTLKGLTGGHSGLYIHEGRANAAKLAAKIFGPLLREVGPSVLMTQIQVGTSTSFSRIPSSFVVRLAMPENKIQEVHQLVESLLTIEKWNYRESEKINLIQIESKSIQGGASTFAMFPSETQHLLQTIQSLNNGVLVRDDRFPNQVVSSSNLGFLILAYNPEQRVFQSSFGVFLRSFISSHFNLMEARQRAAVTYTLHPDDLTVADHIEPWFNESPEPSWLIRRLHPHFPHYGIQPVAGIMEIAIFQRYFPETQFLGIGPWVLEEHGNRERIHLGHWAQTIRDFDQMLLIVGDSPEFAAGPRLDP